MALTVLLKANHRSNVLLVGGLLVLAAVSWVVTTGRMDGMG